MTIAVIGQGYVGLVATLGFASLGHDVIGVDSDSNRIRQLKNGTVPFFEPGLDEFFEANRGRVRFTGEIAVAVAKSDLIFLAVGTPERSDGSSDMDATFAAMKAICETATEPKTVVLKSTVPIGTFRKIDQFCKENSRFEMGIVNNPEFLRQGSALTDFLHPSRIVIGCSNPRAERIIKNLYEPLIDGRDIPILIMDNASAEMAKYAANAFLALKISFINELALLADQVGADIDRVRDGFTSDTRINPAFFNPGIGYGGSCFPKDIHALIHMGKQFGIDLRVLQAADEVNEDQKTILTKRLFKLIGPLQGVTVGIWGLAFKPGTDDVRRAPSLKIIEELFRSGAKIKAYDPVASENARAASRAPFVSCNSALDAVEGVSALLIVTEWPEFRSVDWKHLKGTMKRPLVLDGRNLFDPADMEFHGIEYYAIGRQMRTQARGKESARPKFSSLGRSLDLFP